MRNIFKNCLLLKRAVALAGLCVTLNFLTMDLQAATQPSPTPTVTPTPTFTPTPTPTLPPSAILTTYEQWKVLKFTVAEQNNPAISGPLANPDGDALTNLYEYAKGFEPKTINVNDGNGLLIHHRPKPGAGFQWFPPRRY